MDVGVAGLGKQGQIGRRGDRKILGLEPADFLLEVFALFPPEYRSLSNVKTMRDGSNRHSAR